MSTYNYSLSSDFGGSININRLHDVIEDNGTITPAIQSINVDGDNVDIIFDTGLGGGGITELNSIVSSHNSTAYTAIRSSTARVHVTTTDPGVNNDDYDGFDVGSQWFNTSNDKSYICLDSSPGAAVWKETTQDAHTSASTGVHGVSGSVVGTTDAQTLTNKTLTDTVTSFQNNGDNTKKAKFDLAGIQGGTTRTISIPNFSTTMVGTDASQTLTNKSWGDNLDMGANRITDLDEPVADTDAATKKYVDNVASGLDFKDSVKAASTQDLDSNASISGSITYNVTGGTKGRGQITATLNTTDQFTLDGVNLSSSDDGTRILLKDQTSAAQNGLWTTTVSGTSLTLDRASDYDDDNEVTSGAFCFIEQGNNHGDQGWVLTTNDPIVIGGSSGSALNYVQFTGAGNIIGGDGLVKTDNTIDVGGSTTIIANADNLEVNSSSTANQILLSSGSVGTASTYGALPLDDSNAVTGTLPVSHGGTNTTSFGAGSRVVATNTGNTALETTSLDPANLVTLAGTQTLTNKTLTDSSTTFQDDGDNTKKMQFQLSGITTSTTRTLTIPDADTTILGTDSTQTLTNKTIDADNNTITNIDNADIKSVAAIDATKISDGSVTNTEFGYINTLTSNAQTQLDAKIPFSETNLINIENGSPGSSNHVQFLVTKSHNGADDYNLGIDADPVKVIFSAEDATYRQATVFSADTLSTTATIFGVASSSNSGSNWYPRLVVTQNGNVGIGKNNPGEVLDVSGNISVSGTVDGRDIATDGTTQDNHIATTSAHGVSGDVVGTTDAQTLTNKTLVDATTTFQDDLDGTKQMQFQLSGITSEETRIVTFPDADFTPVGTTLSQTLTNKTINADSNIITNIDNGDIKAGAAIDATKIGDGSVTSTEFAYINTLTSNVQTQIDNHTGASSAHGVSGNVVGTSDTQTLTNKTLTDSTTYLQDNLDNTKKLQFQLTNISPGTTRTITFPDANLTLAGVNAVQTLTNKTLTDNTTYFQDNVDNSKKLQLELSGLTTSTTRTLTAPDTDTTITGTDATQTLTNKTINADNNTITNIANSQIKAGAAVDAAKIANGTVSNTEFQYINTLSSNAQTQLDGKVTLATNQTVSGQKTFSAHTAMGGNASVQADDVLRIDETLTGGGILEGVDLRVAADATSSGQYIVRGMAGFATVTGTNFNSGSTVDGLIYGVYGLGTTVGDASDLVVKGLSTGIYMTNGVTLNVQDAYGADLFLGRDLLGTTGVINATDAYVLKLNNGNDGLSTTNHYGLYIEEPTRGTTNYTIYTTGGDHEFGGDVNVTGNVTLSGTVDGRDVATDGTTLDNHVSSNAAHGTTGNVVGTTDTQTLTNKTLTDSTTYFQDNSDNTKKLQLELSGLSTSTTRTLAAPNSNTTIAGTDAAQTMTNKTWGDNLNMNSNKIINLTDPTADQDAATKAYVDGVASGLDVKSSVVAASTQDLDSNGSVLGSISYNATGGPSGRGQITATLVSSDTFTVDGVDFSSAEDGSRILLKDQSTGAQNGIWTTTVSGTSLTLDRAADYDQDSEVTSGAFCFIEQGTTNADSGWVLTTEDPITIGGGSGTALAYSQFSGAGNITAGTGMTKSGNTLNVVGSSTIIANADDIEVNSSSTSNQVLLSSGSVGTAPTYGALPLGNSNAVSGVLGIANGGTNASSFGAGSRILATNSGNTALETTSINPANVVTDTGSQTLTNKTINADNNTITNIDNGDIKAGAAIDATKIADGTVTSTEFQYINSLSSNAQNQLNVRVTGPGSSTDNAVMRFDGTGGKTAQNSGVTIDDSNNISGLVNLVNTGYHELTDMTAPSNPGSGKGRLYKKTGDDGIFWKPDAAGPEVDLTMNTGEVNTATNIGVGGVGIFKQKNGEEFEFKKINGGSNKITITDDTGNNEVDVDVVEANLTLNNVGGTLGVSKGGTGNTTLTSGNVLVGAGTSAVTTTKAAPSGSFVGTTDAQTLTNKTFTDNVTTFQGSVDNSKKLRLDLSGLTTATTRTLTVPDENTTLVGTATTQSLSNKTINADNNTVTNIDNASIKSGAGIDATKIADGSVTSTEFQYINTLTSNAQTQLNSRVVGPGSSTDNAIMRFDGSGGKTSQNSGVTIDDSNNVSGVVNLTNSGYYEMADISAPANPGAGKGRLYKKTRNDGLFWKPDAAGPEIDLTTDTDTGESNTGSNIGTAGVGVYKGMNSTVLEFKKINAGSNKITITDDTGNNEIDINVTEANLTLNNIGGTLSVSKGGTGKTSLTSGNVLVGAGTSAVATTKAAPSGDFVGTTDTQTLTNKTFTDSSTTFQDNLDTSKKLQFQLSGITTATTRTLTVPDANTTVVGTDVTQTLTNKTINADNNTITNIDNGDIKAGAAIDATKIADGSVTTTEFQYINTLTSNAQTQLNSKVSGPGSSIDNAVVRFDGTGGKTAQNSGVRIDDSNNMTGIGYTELTDVSAPTNPGSGKGRLYKKTGNDGIFWKPDTAGPEVDLTQSGSTTEVIIFRDEKSSKSNGGTFSSGAWRTRTLNTTQGSITGSSLSSNQFTLPTGTYVIEGEAPAYNCDNHQTRIRNTSDSNDVAYGTISSSNGIFNVSSQTNSTVHAVVTIGSLKTFELQHRCTNSQSSNGFGRATGFGGTEVYGTVKVTKIA